MNIKYEIPGTAREIIESLIIKQDYTVKQIAERLGVTSKTVYRIRKGLCPQPKTHLNLIQLYLCISEPYFLQNRPDIKNEPYLL